MNKYFFLLLFLLPKFSLGQSNSLHISTKDSLKVITFWKLMTNAFDKSDTLTIEKNSLEIVDCFCSTDSITSNINYWPADKFAKQFIIQYSTTEKLRKVIEKDKPHLLLSPNNQGKSKNIYSVTYVLYKPNEIAEGHEGASIFFDIIEINGALKIYSIWTIP